MLYITQNTTIIISESEDSDVETESTPKQTLV